MSFWPSSGLHTCFALADGSAALGAGWAVQPDAPVGGPAGAGARPSELLGESHAQRTAKSRATRTRAGRADVRPPSRPRIFLGRWRRVDPFMAVTLRRYGSYLPASLGADDH